ncbi:hypothetical protein [Ktedonobacter racemifer]|uniref:Uncharacterized protein n=1 Tax=Ktedonobacter racemifer DSM 44963 TaxID=485913 RepID=D6U8T5_KTERA|nr:hypothetical protein [Ktedonobacter racemifer]EFH79645.1 hypothetical protein Krac_0123 [Ktedonobacter racemifer DSM 44963]
MTTRKERKPLAVMTPDELQAWLDHRRAAVESFSCDVVAPYLQRREVQRKHRGWQGEGTRIDRQYTAFLREAEELAQGLQELRAMIEVQEGQGQGDQPEPQPS